MEAVRIVSSTRFPKHRGWVVFDELKFPREPYRLNRMSVITEEHRYRVYGDFHTNFAGLLACALPAARASLDGARFTIASWCRVPAFAWPDRSMFSPTWYHLRVEEPGASDFKVGELFDHEGLLTGDRLPSSDADFAENPLDRYLARNAREAYGVGLRR